jgi:hypothetical protein
MTLTDPERTRIHENIQAIEDALYTAAYLSGDRFDDQILRTHLGDGADACERIREIMGFPSVKRRRAQGGSQED